MNLFCRLLALASVAIASPTLDAYQTSSCNADNLYRCLVASRSLALPFCSSYVAPVTTQYVTVTPTSTIYSTRTSTLTILTSQPTTLTTTSTPTTVLTVSKTSTTSRRTTSFHTTTTYVFDLPSAKNRRDVSAQRAIEGPPCLTRDGSASTSYPPSRITSACSCIGITQKTIQTTSTAVPATQSTTTTIIASSTSTEVFTIIVTVTRSVPVTSKTTASADITVVSTIERTTTTTATVTKIPPFCTDPATFDGATLDPDADQLDILPSDFILTQSPGSSLQECCTICFREGCDYYAAGADNTCIFVSLGVNRTAHPIPGDPVLCPFGLVGYLAGNPIPGGLAFGPCAVIGKS